MADQCYSLVTLSLIWQAKENTSSRCEGGPTQKRQRERLNFFFPSPPEPALCKLGEPGGLLVLPEVLTPILRSSFVLFSRAFSFFFFFFLSFSHHYLGLLFFYSNFLTFPPPEMGGPILLD